MWIFQAPYDYIKNLKTPAWLRTLLNFLQNDVIIPILQDIGEEAISYLKHEIISQSKKDILGKDKFNNVVKGFKERYINIKITDRMLSLAIELIVNQLTKSGDITE